jgi:tRNA(Leu) C34 or U34 (ribose-2'-O)-methylase TrmL
MRGYFSIGIDGVTKTGNMGNLIRTAHGFGAAFAFSIRPEFRESLDSLPADSLASEEEKAQIKSKLKARNKGRPDTSKTDKNIPYFEFDSLEEMILPKACQLVAVEITDDAVDMPSFRHPAQAAYILGAERLSISLPVLERCDHVIKIPTRFSLNVATAGAIVMYDRILSMGGFAGGGFAGRPVTPSGTPLGKDPHVQGGVVFRTERD